MRTMIVIRWSQGAGRRDRNGMAVDNIFAFWNGWEKPTNIAGRPMYLFFNQHHHDLAAIYGAASALHSRISDDFQYFFIFVLFWVVTGLAKMEIPPIPFTFDAFVRILEEQ